MMPCNQLKSSHKTPTGTMTTVQELRENVQELEKLETDLEYFSQWQIPQDSPTGVVEESASLIQRYQTAKQFYLQRRLDNLVVERVKTFDETKARNFDFPEVTNKNDEKHHQALASLQTTVQGIHAQVSQLRDSYQTVCTKRQELQQMIQDSDQTMELDEDENNDDTPVAETDMNLEQERIEELQRTKRRMKEQLANMQREKEQIQQRVRNNQNDISLLREQTRGEEDTLQLEQKITELKEMKVFYDSLRQVLEELGGVKIVSIKEDQNTHHLVLDILLYDSFNVEIKMEMYRNTSLKLVSAKWISNPIVQAKMDEEDDFNQQPFSLPMKSLDDIVQVAKTNMPPPHDVRFIVGETLARIRIQQDRVADLALLRRHVLTKIVGDDQIICSLNDGIIVVMRMSDNLVRADQIVGTGGWDEQITNNILETLSRENKEAITPTFIVQHVQMEIQKLKQAGINPKTPTLPRRREA